MKTAERPIGVFDSGVGGISTLAALKRELPGEDFLYIGDTLNAPYGTKTTEEVISCARRVVNSLLQRDIKALVIACNTATGAAAAPLRAELSIPVVAMEPALKPAEEAWRGGRILVLATPLTLRQEKFLGLMDRFGAHAVPLPCPGLMELVEREDDEGAEAYLRRLLAEWEIDKVDAVVLGCTHYVFLKPALRRMLPERVLLTDGNAGTARQLRRVLEGNGLKRARETGGEVRLETTGDAARMLPVMARLLRRGMEIA